MSVYAKAKKQTIAMPLVNALQGVLDFWAFIIVRDLGNPWAVFGLLAVHVVTAVYLIFFYYRPIYQSSKVREIVELVITAIVMILSVTILHNPKLIAFLLFSLAVVNFSSLLATILHYAALLLLGLSKFFAWVAGWNLPDLMEGIDSQQSEAAERDGYA